jgi:hypothetical protein
MELDMRLRCDDINEKWRDSRFKKLNKPDFQLNVDDITKVKKSTKSKLFLTQRNPLVPDYKLPNSYTTEIAPPKFIRDTMDTSDIQGSKPFFKFNHMNPRVSNNVNDIERARPKPFRQPRSRGDKNDSLRVQDISGKQFVSTRQTNPLNPTYKYGHREQSSTTHKMLSEHFHAQSRGKPRNKNTKLNNSSSTTNSNSNSNNNNNNNNNINLDRYGAAPNQLAYNDDGYVVFGEIDGNRPSVYKSKARKKARDRDFSLRTTDMDIKKKVFNPKQAREVINVNDIDGAVTNTTVRMKTLHWKRCVNPLNPEYKLPTATGMYHIDREYDCKKEAPPRSTSTSTPHNNNNNNNNNNKSNHYGSSNTSAARNISSRPQTATVHSASLDAKTLPYGHAQTQVVKGSRPQTASSQLSVSMRAHTHSSALAAASSAMKQATLARSTSNR